MANTPTKPKKKIKAKVMPEYEDKKKSKVRKKSEGNYPIKFPEVEVRIFGGSEYAPLTIDDAKELLGWEEEPDGQTWAEGTALGTTYAKKKFRCLNNPTNRPFRISLAKKYASEFVRGQWKLNGETIIIDKHGHIQSGQHRLIGLILGEELRQSDPDRWRDHYDVHEELTMDTIVVFGVDPSPDVIDSIDQGQKRSFGDVLFRDRRFEGEDVDRKKLKQLSDILAIATRLVWIRSNGERISGAKHFPTSEGLHFLRLHPRIQECVQYVDALRGTDRLISPGYAAGLMYLMAVSGTDPDEYIEEGVGSLDFSLWEKAQEFWGLFYQNQRELPDKHPVKSLRYRLGDVHGGSAIGRDIIAFTVVKAFNYWIDGKKCTEDDLILETGPAHEGGKLLEFPRLGGIDMDPDYGRSEAETKSDEKQAKEQAMKKKKPKLHVSKNEKGQMKGKKWNVGDKGWVLDPSDHEHQPWFAEIVEVYDSKRGAAMDVSTGDVWEVTFSHMSLDYPLSEHESED